LLLPLILSVLLVSTILTYYMQERVINEVSIEKVLILTKLYRTIYEWEL